MIMFKVKKALMLFLFMFVSMPAVCLANVLETMHTAYTIWDVQTINDILKGQIVLPEETLNQYLAKDLETRENKAEQDIKKLEVFFHKDSVMEIHADTKTSGMVVIKTKIKKLVHNKNESIMVLRITDTKIKDGSLLSNLTNLVLNVFTVEMCTKLFGQGIAFKEGIETKLDGNTLTVDFHKWLYNNPIAEKKIEGHSVLDMLEIKEGITDEHVLKLKCSLNIPLEVQNFLLSLLGLGGSKDKNKNNNNLLMGNN